MAPGQVVQGDTGGDCWVQPDRDSPEKAPLCPVERIREAEMFGCILQADVSGEGREAELEK